MNGTFRSIRRWQGDTEDKVGIGSVAPIDAGATDGEVVATPAISWLPIMTAIVVILLACIWLGFSVWERSGQQLPEGLNSAAMIVRESAAPLALLALIYLLVVRTSDSKATRFARISNKFRTERGRLEASLASIALRIERERAAIEDHTHALMAIGEDAAGRLEAIGEKLRLDIDSAVRQAEVLKNAAGSARRDMTALLGDIPQAQSQTLEMTRTLDAAGLAAYERAGALDAQVAALVVRAREADEVAGGAAQRLAAHLARVESVSESAGGHLVGAAETMTAAIDAALGRAASASDAARQGMEAQGAAMLALVAQGEAAIARTGAETADAVARRVADVTANIDGLASLLADQQAASDALIGSLQGGIVEVGEIFASVEEDATARSGRLLAALAALGTQASDLGASLDRGAVSAAVTIGRTEALIIALDRATREIDETLPAALARLDSHAAASVGKIADLAPQVAQVERQAAGALDRLVEAGTALAEQRTTLDGLGHDVDVKLVAGKAAADDMIAAVESADARTREIAAGAGATLVEAMVRVREAAQMAADRAREALACVVPDSADRLAAAARTALSEAVSGEVEVQIDKLATTAERAVSAASTASDRLMRQMLTIAETSAQVEARIGEARGEIEEADRDNFARRVALLIESLNSTAIDVTKVLSNEVTDSAWSAYLKGDRGVFTRRAVRLLDAGEMREVTRHYNEDPEFRDQVNRYVHDFEAMLRNILATRAGSPLGVTLLSSDMGKLYVALAQAIDRLRS